MSKLVIHHQVSPDNAICGYRFGDEMLDGGKLHVLCTSPLPEDITCDLCKAEMIENLRAAMRKVSGAVPTQRRGRRRR